MRYCQAGQVGLAEQLLPESFLGRHVQGARKVVHHPQISLTDKHAGGSGPLKLTAGQLNPAGPDLCFEPFFQGQNVLVEYGVTQGCFQHRFFSGNPLQKIVPERFAKKTRNLGCIGGPRRDEI